MNSELKHTTAYDYERKHNGTGPSVTNRSKIIAADSIKAEEIPTIPIDSLELVTSLQPTINIHSIDIASFRNLPTPLVVQPSEYRRSLSEWFQIWWEGIRPGYLSLSLLPILLGTTLAWTHTVNAQAPLGRLNIGHMIGGIVVASLIQIGGHLINDYYDHIRGIDTGNRLSSGGLIQQRYIKPTFVLKMGFTLLGIGTFLGLLFSIGGGILTYLFGGLIVLGTYLYSAPPHPLSSIALGEITGFIFFGPLLTLIAYMAQTSGSIPVSAFIYSLLPGLLATAVIHTNNLRDSETDTNAQKRTLAYLLGTKASRFVYLLLLSAAYVIVAILGLPPHTPHLILITFWTCPLLIIVINGIMRTKSPIGFHLVMCETLRIQLYFMLLLIVSLIITTFIPVLPHLPSHLL